MTDNLETRAYLVSLEAYWAGAERGKDDGSAKNQPKPLNADAAWEVAEPCSESIAALLDYQKTGKLPAQPGALAGVPNSKPPRSSSGSRNGTPHELADHRTAAH